MSLDTVFAAGQAVAAVHTVVDQVINAALYYGPGAFALTATIAAFRVCTWAVGRYHQLLLDRADRRAYTARAHRLHQVADTTDAVIAILADDLTPYLNNKYDTTPDHAPEEGR
ncbi:hypothetical protein [Streptomyces sp. NPDC006863]|uniref:hypothetical protein n=1 Tax=Streptomyces sp. NPDC006863 TaxID=3154779 RepID=UPI0033D5CF70